MLPQVTIDGEELNQDFFKPIQKIEVSRVFKYQQPSGEASGSPSKQQYRITEWIDMAARSENPQIHKILEDSRKEQRDDTSNMLGFKNAYRLARAILSMNMNLVELSVEDFLDWFNELSTPGPGDGTIAAAGF